jgi:hypothetical protein
MRDGDIHQQREEAEEEIEFSLTGLSYPLRHGGWVSVALAEVISIRHWELTHRLLIATGESAGRK